MQKNVNKRATSCKKRVTIGSFGLILSLAALAGCSESNLFVKSDPSDAKLKYFDDDDSAQASHDAHEQSRAMGFGFGSGANAQ